MKNNEKKESHCLICGKTIRSSKKIRICQDCKNRGKGISLTAIGIVAAGLGINKVSSKK
ncbi:hypothetical protein HMPREF9088_0875 [Enterococcus italicus DSM 15952]|uniref:Uncharacterized protein n=1 Tax=Enterococcus italicus (strain DSM 15952 / CCUG 50447 / LMG 22039 / TP 1.5) TaxID=888064 RepID=E6LET5_ENTI1|nr:hypothetical protein [Enterococcus italicus]EFU74286.1 hypothetical protein HMPREF9088_0875 [Enterococcus italicus DSM 15952]